MSGKPNNQGARSTPVSASSAPPSCLRQSDPDGPVLSVRSRPAAADRLWRLVVEEWLSHRPSTPWTTFPQVGSIYGDASRLPVKPSAQPTQVRTLDLPPIDPQVRPGPVGRVSVCRGAVCMTVGLAYPGSNRWTCHRWRRPLTCSYGHRLAFWACQRRRLPVIVTGYRWPLAPDMPRS